MRKPVDTAQLPKQALQAYLDGLLQEATEAELLEPEPLPAATAPVQASAPAPEDDFEAAVREEQARDGHGPAARALTEPVALVPTPVATTPAPASTVSTPAAPAGQAGGPAAPAALGPPAWADEPFECLLFDVAGLTLAVPLVCLGSIYPLAGQELTPLFGQPEWFLGLLPSHNGNLKVLDTARWVMPDRYRDDFQQGLQYVISVQGYEWGLAVHSVSRSLRLDPSQVKWRGQRGQRPWLAGTVIEHMCALLDVAQLAEMISSGAIKRQEAEARAKAKAEADAKAQAAAASRRKR